MGSIGNIKTGLTSTSGWDYREYVGAIDKIETAFNSLQKNINRFYPNNAQARISNIVRQLNTQDTIITRELEENKSGVGDRGNERVLMTQRRRVRQLTQRVKKFGESLYR